jgi:hypothetical protein
MFTKPFQLFAIGDARAMAFTNFTAERTTPTVSKHRASNSIVAKNDPPDDGTGHQDPSIQDLENGTPIFADKGIDPDDDGGNGGGITKTDSRGIT